MWFICLRRSILPREQWTVSIDEHLVWMKEMHEAGRILMSGPGKGPDGTAYGIYLIRAASKQDAEAVAAGDPFTVAGHSAFDIIEWEVHQIMGAGGFTMAAMQASRDLDSGSISLPVRRRIVAFRTGERDRDEDGRAPFWTV